jgi:hypothetical protein
MLFRVQFKKRIPLLLAKCLTPELVDECAGLYHTLKDLFDYFTENCLEFMVHDLCALSSLIQKSCLIK